MINPRTPADEQAEKQSATADWDAARADGHRRSTSFGRWMVWMLAGFVALGLLIWAVR